MIINITLSYLTWFHGLEAYWIFQKFIKATNTDKRHNQDWKIYSIKLILTALVVVTTHNAFLKISGPPNVRFEGITLTLRKLG